jgi:hypothetical protein
MGFTSVRLLTAGSPLMEVSACLYLRFHGWSRRSAKPTRPPAVCCVARCWQSFATETCGTVHLWPLHDCFNLLVEAAHTACAAYVVHHQKRAPHLHRWYISSKPQCRASQTRPTSTTCRPCVAPARRRRTSGMPSSTMGTPYSTCRRPWRTRWPSTPASWAPASRCCTTPPARSARQVRRCHVCTVLAWRSARGRHGDLHQAGVPYFYMCSRDGDA